MKICACLNKKTITECLKTIPEIKSDLIEHRIDYLEEEISIENLRKLYSNTKVPIISTCRSINCQGFFNKSEEDRILTLFSAINAGCQIIDIEIETDEKLMDSVIKKAKENNCKILISLHDFKNTPGLQELKEKLNQIKSLGADFAKIVTCANKYSDNTTIYELIDYSKSIDMPIVAFTMGDIGKITRISSIFHGSEFTYCSLEKETAPAQISLNKMKKIIEELS